MIYIKLFNTFFKIGLFGLAEGLRHAFDDDKVYGNPLWVGDFTEFTDIALPNHK